MMNSFVWWWRWLCYKEEHVALIINTYPTYLWFVSSKGRVFALPNAMSNTDTLYCVCVCVPSQHLWAYPPNSLCVCLSFGWVHLSPLSANLSPSTFHFTFPLSSTSKTKKQYKLNCIWLQVLAIVIIVISQTGCASPKQTSKPWVLLLADRTRRSLFQVCVCWCFFLFDLIVTCDC